MQETQDLDAGELGGMVSFTSPGSERVVSYVIYLVTWKVSKDVFGLVG